MSTSKISDLDELDGKVPPLPFLFHFANRDLTPQSQPDVVLHSSTAPACRSGSGGEDTVHEGATAGDGGPYAGDGLRGWGCRRSRRRRRREDGDDDGDSEGKREKGLNRVALTLGTRTRLPRGVGVEGDVGRRHGRALLHPHPEPKGRREEMFPSEYPRRYGSPESAFRVRFPPPFHSVISAYHLPLHSIKPRTQPQTP